MIYETFQKQSIAVNPRTGILIGIWLPGTFSRSIKILFNFFLFTYFICLSICLHVHMGTMCMPGEAGSPKRSPGTDGCEPLWELSLRLLKATNALKCSTIFPSPTSGFLAKVYEWREKGCLQKCNQYCNSWKAIHKHTCIHTYMHPYMSAVPQLTNCNKGCGW